jgi:cyclic 2,3-diphosphoglycerate synthetase
LTELKAAAVDVASVRAVDRGAEVVFVDNRPVSIDGADLDERIEEVLDLTVGRASDRTAKGTGG